MVKPIDRVKISWSVHLALHHQRSPSTVLELLNATNHFWKENVNLWQIKMRCVTPSICKRPNPECKKLRHQPCKRSAKHCASDEFPVHDERATSTLRIMPGQQAILKLAYHDTWKQTNNLCCKESKLNQADGKTRFTSGSPCVSEDEKFCQILTLKKSLDTLTHGHCKETLPRGSWELRLTKAVQWALQVRKNWALPIQAVLHLALTYGNAAIIATFRMIACTIWGPLSSYWNMIGKIQAHTTASLEIRGLPNLQTTLEPRTFAKLSLWLQINLKGLGWTKGRCCLIRGIEILSPGTTWACMHFFNQL